MWIVIAIVVIGGIWWYVASMNPGDSTYNSGALNSGTQPATTTMNQPTQPNQPAQSNQTADQNMAQIDAQMKAYALDSATVDQSMNDQPVTQ